MFVVRVLSLGFCVCLLSVVCILFCLSSVLHSCLLASVSVFFGFYCCICYLFLSFPPSVLLWSVLVCLKKKGIVYYLMLVSVSYASICLTVSLGVSSSGEPAHIFDMNGEFIYCLIIVCCCLVIINV